MGAFDGYITIQSWPSSKRSEYEVYPYFSNQPAFNFYKGFGMSELKELYEKFKYNTIIWIPVEGSKSSGIGVTNWYLKALIENYDK